MRWLAILPFLGILVGTPFFNSTTPVLFGFPVILVWLVFWVVATSAIMAVVYQSDPANHAGGQAEPRSGSLP
jgi:hypothetical protein